MQIEAIEIRNYRLFRDAKLTDLPRMTVVVGAMSWSACIRWAVVAWALTMTAAQAQVVTNPNLIRGEIRFVNVAPDVVAILEDHGISDGTRYAHRVEADGLPPNENLSAVRELDPVSGPLSIPYELTVESSADGIAYALSGRLRTNGDRARYWLETRVGPTVYSLPAPPAELDFEECAAIVRLRFVDEGGARVEVPFGDAWVHRLSPNREVAYSSIHSGHGDEVILVTPAVTPTVELEVQMDVGRHSDFSRISIHEERTVAIACDEVADVEIPVPTFGSDGTLAQIEGEFDLLGLQELQLGNARYRNPHVTDIRATLGPFRNVRDHQIKADPSSGLFLLPNVLPSDYVDPPDPYELSAFAAFGQRETFGTLLTPSVEISPTAGETLNVGDTFVMTPAFLTGDVLVAGPPPLSGATAPLEAALGAEDFDRDGDGHPETGYLNDFSEVSALGPQLGHADSAIGPRFSRGVSALQGRFRLPVVTINDGRPDSEWVLSDLDLRLDSVEAGLPAGDAESFIDQHVRVVERSPAPLAATPGAEHEADLRYCTSTLHFRYETTEGRLYAPRLSSNGSFAALDAWGSEADYLTYAAAYGTPVEQAAAAEEALVVATLLQGEHELRPTVGVLLDDGSASSVTLDPFSLVVGCRQQVEVGESVAVQLDVGLTPCAAAGTTTIEGRVTAAEPIRRIWHQVNGGAPMDVCTDCGADPPFSIDLTLEEGQNVVRVVVEDESGREASVTSHASTAVEPSALDRWPEAEPLLVRKMPGSTELAIGWEDVPFQFFDVHVGTIDSLWDDDAYDHGLVGNCGSSQNSSVVTVEPARAYILVASDCGHGDSSLGRNSLGAERDAARPACP